MNDSFLYNDDNNLKTNYKINYFIPSINISVITNTCEANMLT